MKWTWRSLVFFGRIHCYCEPKLIVTGVLHYRASYKAFRATFQGCRWQNKTVLRSNIPVLFILCYVIGCVYVEEKYKRFKFNKVRGVLVKPRECALSYSFNHLMESQMVQHRERKLF